MASIAEENSSFTTSEVFLHNCLIINLADTSSSIIIQLMVQLGTIYFLNIHQFYLKLISNHYIVQ